MISTEYFLLEAVTSRGSVLCLVLFNFLSPLSRCAVQMLYSVDLVVE
jgi:hypothetical protein